MVELQERRAAKAEAVRKRQRVSQRPTANSLQPTACSQRPTANGLQPPSRWRIAAAAVG